MADSEWADEWMRAWRSFPGAGDANPWTAMLDHFTKGRVSYHQPFADAMDRITEQSRAFFELGQHLASNGGEGWQGAVFKHLDELRRELENPEAAARAFGGTSPLDYWQQFAGHWGDSPAGHQSLMSQLDQLLRMPGLGFTREHQESLQELSRLWLDYERAYCEYAAYCAETARRSVERLRERLAVEFGEGGGPASIRSLYNAWVACSEEVYAERVAAGEYVKLHGRMVNALLAYRRHVGRIMDQWMKAANLPGREEIDALHRKLKDTQHELRALQARSSSTRQTRKATRKKKRRKKKRAGTQ